MQRPPEGESITILVQPLSIEDVPPEVGETAAAVRKLWSERTGGPSGINVEHLKAWLWEATREKYQYTETWDKEVSVIQVAFWEGYILEALTWTTMVLAPKGSGEHRGIGLVETIWKVCK